MSFSTPSRPSYPLKVILPFPWNSPSTQSPSNSPASAEECLPTPCIAPSRQLPSHTCPTTSILDPVPCSRPSTKSPLYLDAVLIVGFGTYVRRKTRAGGGSFRRRCSGEPRKTGPSKVDTALRTGRMVGLVASYLFVWSKVLLSAEIEIKEGTHKELFVSKRTKRVFPCWIRQTQQLGHGVDRLEQAPRKVFNQSTACPLSHQLPLHYKRCLAVLKWLVFAAKRLDTMEWRSWECPLLG